MKFTRRNFVKLGMAAGAALAIEDKLGMFAEAADLELGGRGAHVGSNKVSGESWDKVVPYTCLVCNIEDGGLAFIKNGKVKKLEGNPRHPSTRGRLCAKGNAGMNHVYDPDRILYPIKRTGARGADKWKKISWEEGISTVAEKIDAVIKKGPDHYNEVMIKYGRDRSGGAKSRFAKTIGTSNVINHTSTCESSKKVGMEHTWGPDIETPDFANTKYILNFGSNIMETAYFMNPYAQRVIEGVVDNHAKLVTFDVRLSNTAGRSTEWFPVFPGTDGLIALAMANTIMQEGLADEDFINTWTNYPSDKLKKYLSQFSVDMAESYSGVSASDIRRIAIEFASVHPATTYTYRGPSKHLYGSYAERCTMLLPIITGNIEVKGGFCLPRGMGYGQPSPKPGKKPSHKSFLAAHPDYPLAGHKVCQLVPFWIREGKQKISVYINYFGAESYTHPAAPVWDDLLRDEKAIPFSISMSNQMNETVALMDMILPGVSYLERWDPENMPSSLHPWVGLRQPVVTPLGESRENRTIFKDIIHKIDPTGSRGMKKYWEFSSPEDHVKQQFAGVKGLDWGTFKKTGVYPNYGKLDPQSGKVVGSNGREIEAEFGLPYKVDKKGKIKVGGKRRKGFSPAGGKKDGKIHIYADGYKKYGFNPLPTFKPHPWHWESNGASKLRSNEFIFTTFKWATHVQSRTMNCKLLLEFVSSNPVWINTASAKNLGIKDGALVRITSGCGYIVNRAHVTQGIHPKVAAQSNTFGTKYGRFATAQKSAGAGTWGGMKDPDLKSIWWGQNGETGVNANNIVPAATDPIGGSVQWYDTVVTVAPAKSGDKYGDTKADIDKHWDFYHETMSYAYTGKNHLKMHPESKGIKLPKPGSGGGGGH